MNIPDVESNKSHFEFEWEIPDFSDEEDDVISLPQDNLKLMEFYVVESELNAILTVKKSFNTLIPKVLRHKVEYLISTMQINNMIAELYQNSDSELDKHIFFFVRNDMQSYEMDAENFGTTSRAVLNHLGIKCSFILVLEKNEEYDDMHMYVFDA